MLLFAANETDNVIEVRNAQTLESTSSFCVDKNEPPGLWACTSFNGCGVFAARYGNRVCLLDYKGKRTKLLNVGAYPVCAVSDKENAFIACADSNSIWTVNKNFEAEFIDTTIDFPFSMAISDEDICICGLLNGEVITYCKKSFKKRRVVYL